ncbi:MAG: hypothetical protein ACK5RE_14710 [Pseudanabaena sp.]|jgi:hypothetical protein
MPLDSHFYCLLHKYIFSDYEIAPLFKAPNSDRPSKNQSTSDRLSIPIISDRLSIKKKAITL